MLDTFGGRAKLARMKLELSQKEVVELLAYRGIDITRAHYSKVEGNKVNPSRDVVEAMCYVLQCSADWLMGLPDFGQHEKHRHPVGLPIDHLDDDIQQALINLYQSMVQWNTERGTLHDRLAEVYHHSGVIDDSKSHRLARAN